MSELDQLKKEFNLKIKNENLIKLAFIHRSYLNEAKIKKESNERLEFLGDSILSYLVSKFLYLNYPHLPEGELTNLRSSVVKTQTLADIAKSLKLGMYLKLSRGEEEGGGRNNPSILADTFEALLGAILLDSGLSSVEKILNNFLYILIPQILNDKTYKDSKSSFQEMVQEETKLSPIYKVINETGPDHAKEFTVAVIVKNKVWGQGSGKTKQEAEQKAAASAIEKWQQK
ncbi:ribonuclease III [Candidatus Gottesmanbacteria bacterium RIFCSPHIGHO2_02_FULL_39_14]|uniref:Ribonuclease 3 n=2 Tax=Candidatus Gottesmaniibacteriota TaxID=1752720 RepID=A0A1F5ZW89_9BACT|nr:MAG: ribonuclease III [Candidatus Gottesmanbacteria bacterium RIFCSPHIGHO2_02_FULL_39_14]